MKTALLVVLIVLALGALLSRLRLGGTVTYSAEGAAVSIRVGALSFQVFPGKKNSERDGEKKPKKAKKSKASKKKKAAKADKSREKAKKEQTGQAKEKKASPPLGGSLELLMDALPEVFELLGGVVRRLRVDELLLDYTIAGRHDAAGAAMQYGAICATGGAVYGLLLQHLAIRKQSIQARVDFQAEEPLVYLRLGLSYTLGQLVVLAVIALRKLLPLWKKWNQLRENTDSNKTSGR